MVMAVVMGMGGDFGFFVFACSLIAGIGNPLRYGRGAASQLLDEKATRIVCVEEEIGSGKLRSNFVCGWDARSVSAKQ